MSKYSNQIDHHQQNHNNLPKTITFINSNPYVTAPSTYHMSTANTPHNIPILPPSNRQTFSAIQHQYPINTFTPQFSQTMYSIPREVSVSMPIQVPKTLIAEPKKILPSNNEKTTSIPIGPSTRHFKLSEKIKKTHKIIPSVTNNIPKPVEIDPSGKKSESNENSKRKRSDDSAMKCSQEKKKNKQEEDIYSIPYRNICLQYLPKDKLSNDELKEFNDIITKPGSIKELLVFRETCISKWPKDKPYSFNDFIETYGFMEYQIDVLKRYWMFLEKIEYIRSNDRTRNTSRSSNLLSRAKENIEKYKDACIVVIGASVCGLNAAKKLKELGLSNIVILEYKDSFCGIMNSVEDCASILNINPTLIHNIFDNPIDSLAVSIGLKESNSKPNYILYDSDYNMVTEEKILKIELVLRNIIEKAKQTEPLQRSIFKNFENSKLEFSNDLERDIFLWYKNLLTTFIGGYVKDKKKTSNTIADLEISKYRELIKNMSEGLDIKLNSQVLEINGQSPNISIKYLTNKRSIKTLEADAVIITLPFSDIISSKVALIPPPEKDLIQENRTYYSYKVIIIFPYVFWDEDVDYIGVLNDSEGRSYLFINQIKNTGKPVLSVYVVGTRKNDKFTSENIESNIFQVLQKLYNNDVPYAYKTYISRNTFYSSTNIKNEIRCPIQNRIYFAGELSNLDKLTFGGSYQRGLNEANKLIENLLNNKIRIMKKNEQEPSQQTKTETSDTITSLDSHKSNTPISLDDHNVELDSVKVVLNSVKGVECFRTNQPKNFTIPIETYDPL